MIVMIALRSPSLPDPTVCIGCKACEVASKEWNDVSGRDPEAVLVSQR
jgi:Fe-S-cluster-containing dehydrogenase component